VVTVGVEFRVNADLRSSERGQDVDAHAGCW
jgi:hypothetical protein